MAGIEHGDTAFKEQQRLMLDAVNPGDTILYIIDDYKGKLRKIQVYRVNPLKILIYQGLPPITSSNLMCFPLFLPLRAETRESFYFPPTTLSRSLADDRLASRVEWA